MKVTATEFEKVLEARITNIRQTLIVKAKQYASANDHLYNFGEGAKFLQTTPEICLLGYLTKHLVSVADLCRNASSKQSLETWQEKIGDAINYLILLEAMVTKRLEDD